MNDNPFEKLPTMAIAILQEAKKTGAQNWQSDSYKAAYLAFCDEYKGNVSADRFDALVNWWGKLDRHRTSGFKKNRGDWSVVANRMMTNEITSKKSMRPMTFDELHKALKGENY